MSPQEEKKNRYKEISRKYGDHWIWGIYIMLVIISIVESYSASSREVAKMGIYMPIVKQCIFLGVGAICVVGLMHVDYNHPVFLYIMVPVLALFTVFFLIFVMKFGIYDWIIFFHLFCYEFLHIILQDTKYVDHVFVDIKPFTGQIGKLIGQVHVQNTAVKGIQDSVCWLHMADRIC